LEMKLAKVPRRRGVFLSSWAKVKGRGNGYGRRG